MHWAIETQGLTRRFKSGVAKRWWRRRRNSENGNGETVALDGVDLTVKPGELFGLLGPNGAGKTTLLKILSTLLLPSDGRALVDGFDVASDPEGVRKRINMVSGGEHSGFGILTVRETIWMFAQFYGVPTKIVRDRTDRMMEALNLTSYASMKVSKLSTGTRQKMNIIRGFVTDPKILYLDEPTLGLDVGVAREVRSFIRTWMDENPDRTVILTTHYMAEADSMCDRIAIIDKGKVRACNTPDSLKRDWAPAFVYRIEIPLWTGRANPLTDLAAVSSVDLEHHDERGRSQLRAILKSEDGLDAVHERLNLLGAPALSVMRQEPTLEDAFLNLVGHGLKAEKGNGSTS